MDTRVTSRVPPQGALKIGAAVGFMHYADSVGRRPLLLFSACATAATLFSLSITFAFLPEASGHVGYVAWIVALLFTYNTVFEIGLGPGCWLIPSRGGVATQNVDRPNGPLGVCRGDAAAATWILRGTESRRRRGRDVDIP